jgi:hypothetical protein
MRANGLAARGVSLPKTNKPQQPTVLSVLGAHNELAIQ